MYWSYYILTERVAYIRTRRPRHTQAPPHTIALPDTDLLSAALRCTKSLHPRKTPMKHQPASLTRGPKMDAKSLLLNGVRRWAEFHDRTSRSTIKSGHSYRPAHETVRFPASHPSSQVLGSLLRHRQRSLPRDPSNNDKPPRYFSSLKYFTGARSYNPWHVYHCITNTPALQSRQTRHPRARLLLQTRRQMWMPWTRTLFQPASTHV